MRRRNKSILFAVLAFVLAATLSCNSRSTDTPDRSANAPGPVPSQKQKLKVNLAAVEKAIHDRINAERLKHGLPTMRLDAALTRIARKHSQDMVARNYFSHVSPEGYDQAYRYQKNGYACGITVDGVIRTGAENIAQFPLNTLLSTGAEGTQRNRYIREKIATSVVQEWMTSPDERKNILSPTWQREGIGLFLGPEDIVIITLNFC